MNGIHGNAIRENEIENLKTFRGALTKKYTLIVYSISVCLVRRFIDLYIFYRFVYIRTARMCFN